MEMPGDRERGNCLEEACMNAEVEVTGHVKEMC
jgi:hypothetical protein